MVDLLDHNPDEVDLTEIRNTLSAAHEVASDGLNRSQKAARCESAEESLSALQVKYDSLVSELDLLRNEAAAAKTALSAFSPVVESLRSALAGKVLLIGSYSPERKKQLSVLCETASVEELVSLKVQVESDFNSSWLDKPSVLGEEKNFIDYKLFSTGVNNAFKPRSK
jgi:hypothetical protein